jgi:UMF1 family MFS transporter
MEKDHRKVIISWCFYDWANSAFAATIMAAVLPFFYSSIAGANLSKTIASSYWGYTNTIAMLIVAFSAPILGALADHSGMKKKFLAGFAFMGITSTALLVFVGKGDWFLASLLYIVGMVGFSG